MSRPTNKSKSKSRERIERAEGELEGFREQPNADLERAAFKGSRDLPCMWYGAWFAAAEESIRASADALSICRGCDHRLPCLEQALEQEVGVRGDSRLGVAGGLTGRERAAVARRAGCGVCGTDLPDGGASLYCRDHQHRGAKDSALAQSA